MKKKLDVRIFRETHGYTQDSLATALGVSRNYVYLIESGKKPLSDKLLIKLEKLELMKSADAAAPPMADDSTAPPPRSTEQRNLPAKQAPSEEALKLLGMLYDLDRTALPIHNRAHLENDKPNMAVASVVLNFISLVRSCESDMSALGKVATIVYQVHLSMDGDQSQIRMTKTILDSLCQIP